MQTRILGRTGEELSMVGFGGIVVMDDTQAAANTYVEQAIERGINYFDVAPNYGNAQDRLGPALEPFRSDIFLSCKTSQRTADEAEADLAGSLKALRTDRIDLYQLHAVASMEQVETILGPGGALETFVNARERGLVRFLGFSAHSEEAALALMEAFDFDTILFPFNWACWLKHGFGEKVLWAARDRDMGILALKTLARRKWKKDEERTWPKCWYAPVESEEEALQAFRFTMSRPVTAAVSPGHAGLLWWACEAAEHFRPLSQEEEAELARQAAELDTIFPG